MRSYKKSKKAQVETQFNWIFILIVGALILAFFTVIVIKQKGASETRASGKMTNQLNTILVGAGVSSGTVQVIPIPLSSIRFTCDDYYIGPASRRLGNRIVFAPEEIQTDKLITWTLDWNMPFKVTNFLYISSPLVRYLIVHDTSGKSAAEEVFSKFPDKFSRELVSTNNLQSIEDENDDRIRVIAFTSTPPSLPADLKADSITGLQVAPSTATSSKAGKVSFLTESGGLLTPTGSAIDYLTHEELFGAILTEDPEEFSCLMYRAYKRLHIVADIYYRKFNSLAPLYTATNCEGFYSQNSDFASIIQATDPVSHSLIMANRGTLASSMTTLEFGNTKLQLNSCPLFY